MSPNHSRRHKQILLLVETSRQYGRDIIAGVTQYVRENSTWNIYFEDRGLNEKVQANYDNWDGIIARSASDEMANSLKAWGGPLVELLHTNDATRIPDVMGDSATISEMAIEHFLERRIRHFAYFSLFSTWWSSMRCELFRQILNKRGFDCHVFETPAENVSDHPSPLIHWNSKVAKSLPLWLKSLPKPVGLLVTTDSYAMYVYEACYSLGIAIPE
ncbi:MAG: substrate-binding domain-containing protein, partial [Planctomycetia bacterium]|nr:substrate-binding domain-containing protein [Planctomycetia bacterium]